ncbi:hypothetical protein [Streptococcus sp. sy018]|uniref:hypothetical protein n=1 Tax=Streptococcus sp. sy018 TaxID=2600147 RepID=UPI0011B63A32|nr:hypothetical protein [Streptococcus sp. sy018]TWS94418.1 hypothetical protein FRX52_04580 [Streptococcus sp. sy018]
MIKKTLLLIVTISLLYGLSKLYIAYNLSHYAGYYVQQLPRKKGTNPELALVVDYVGQIKEPDQDNIFFRFKGRGTIYNVIQQNRELALLAYQENDDEYYLMYSFNYDQKGNSISDDSYWFNEKGQFTYYDHSEEGNSFQSKDIKYRDKASQLSSEIISPVLAVQPKPLINLQTLFNQKHEARFND